MCTRPQTQRSLKVAVKQKLMAMFKCLFSNAMSISFFMTLELLMAQTCWTLNVQYARLLYFRIFDLTSFVLHDIFSYGGKSIKHILKMFLRWRKYYYIIFINNIETRKSIKQNLKNCRVIHINRELFLRLTCEQK